MTGIVTVLHKMVHVIMLMDVRATFIKGHKQYVTLSSDFTCNLTCYYFFKPMLESNKTTTETLAIYFHTHQCEQIRRKKPKHTHFCSVLAKDSPLWTNRTIVSCTPSRGRHAWYCYQHGRTSHCDHIDRAKTQFPEWVELTDYSVDIAGK
jgi:hypothetical protein